MAFQLSGSLDEIPLPDIARLFQSTRKTGRLSLVSGHSTGFLFFDHGDIVDCQSTNMAGIDALKHIALFNRGTFDFADGVMPASQTLNQTTTADLIDILETRMMESRQLQELVPALNEIPRYMGGSIPTDLELGAAELAVAMKASTGNLTARQLAHDLSLDETMVRYAIARFRAAGLMDIVGVNENEEAESAPPAPSNNSHPVAPPPRNTDVPGSPTTPTTGGQVRYWRGRKIEG